MKNAPWGIIGGICAIVAFFATTGTIGAFIVLDRMAAQTSGSATLFDTWWQTAMFAAALISMIGLIYSAAMYVKRKREERGISVNEETV